MKFFETPIQGLALIEPAVFADDRGHFFESFSEKELRRLGLTLPFVQDNQSVSSKDVLRGLHFQKPPFEQGKLVRVARGSVIDVAVDIRAGSTTYGQHYSVLLSGKNNKMFWIPPGFAHGFLSLEDDTIFLYKCTNYYNKESEGGIRYDDPAIQIAWNVENPIVSGKDLALPSLNEIKFHV
jgi:dTDP-4-dehydrorhamnose 3,5-epimerase